MKNKFMFGHHCVIGFLGMETNVQLYNFVLSYKLFVKGAYSFTADNEKFCSGHIGKYVDIFQYYYPYLITGYLVAAKAEGIVINLFFLGVSVSFNIKFPWKKRDGEK